jgi:hypothetical protein
MLRHTAFPLSEESVVTVLWMLLVAKVIHLERSVPTILYSIHEFPQPGEINQMLLNRLCTLNFVDLVSLLLV